VYCSCYYIGRSVWQFGTAIEWRSMAAEKTRQHTRGRILGAAVSLVGQERLARDGIDPATATLVRLATNGLWFADLFGLASPGGRPVTSKERVR
jgi:Tetracyclin repressor-like, C-terminal domain